MRIAVQQEGSEELKAFLEQTVKSLATVDHKRVPDLVYVPIRNLQNPATLNDIDYLVVSASVFAALEKYSGLKPIVSVRPMSSLNADHASSTAVIIPQSAKNITTLRDLNNKKIGVSTSASPDLKAQFANELLIQGIKNPNRINFKEIRNDWETVIADLLNGTVDAVLSDPVKLKQLSKEQRNAIKVLEPRINDDYALAHTTSTYPGWVLGATLKPSRIDSDRLEMFLKSLIPYDGLCWSDHGDYRKIHQILTNLNEPFYKSFRKKSWKDIVEENQFLILMVILFLLGWGFHTFSTNRLVSKRTRELWEANEQKLKTEEKFHSLEKASIVGQMSNIVAHELRQPLAAISNYSLAIKRRLQNGNLNEDALSFAIAKLLKESSRASEIIEHVQQYAKGTTAQYSRFNLNQLINGICNSYQNSQGQTIVSFQAEKSLDFIGDPLEIELVVRNLIKNSLEAVQNIQHASIQIKIKEITDGVLLEVSDNGPIIPEHIFEHFSQPLKSTKIGGLGLGLSIVKRISEIYSGHTVFDRISPSGLKVSVWLYNKTLGDFQ